MKHVINGICVVLGFISIGVGAIGIVLPILPTTPFLLLALVLFAKGSERFHRWFMTTKMYKNYLESFVADRSMTKEAKIRVLTVLTILMAAGIWFSPVFVKIILAAVLIFHYVYFLFGIRTITKAEAAKTGAGKAVAERAEAERAEAERAEAAKTEAAKKVRDAKAGGNLI